MKKHVFYSEIAFLLGVVFIAIGVVFMEKADFGVSMVVAPAYIIYRAVNPLWQFFSFGMAEYLLQAVLILLLLIITRKFQISYVLSFVTAVIYGFILDGLMALGTYLPITTIWFRLLYYVLGILTCSFGVAMMFNTYLPPEAYELFVKVASKTFKTDIHKFKTIYDCVSCVIGIILSFSIFGFGKFIGVKVGTIICAIINGFIISLFSKTFNKHFDFKDAFPWRAFFEGKTKSTPETKGSTDNAEIKSEDA